MDILNILKSKPHNLHYLNRYYNFILGCIEKNKTLDKSVYTENHHICPKSDDLFPEYTDTTHSHKWNNIALTGKQHFIAHRILWKTYVWSGMTYSFYCMSTMRVSPLLGRERYRITSTTFAILRENAAKNNSLRNTGIATMKVIGTDIAFRISCSDINDTMVGYTFGTTPTINLITGERTLTSLEEFYSNDKLVSPISGTVAVRNLDTGKITRISSNEYHSIDRPSNLLSQLAGNVNVRDVVTGKYRIFSKDEYINRTSNIVPFAKDKLIVKDIRTGEKYQEDVSVFYSEDKPWYIVAASSKEVTYTNLLTGDVGRMPKEEFDNSPDHVVGIKWSPKVCLLSNKKEITMFKFDKLCWD